jgi:hypothetical protein
LVGDHTERGFKDRAKILNDFPMFLIGTGSLPILIEVLDMKNLGNKKRKRLSFAGAGLALGAAFGILVGMLLFESPWVGPMLGAACGLVIALVVDLSQTRKGKS